MFAEHLHDVFDHVLPFKKCVKKSDMFPTTQIWIIRIIRIIRSLHVSCEPSGGGRAELDHVSSLTRPQAFFDWRRFCGRTEDSPHDMTGEIS